MTSRRVNIPDTNQFFMRPVYRRLNLSIRGVELGPLDDYERADVIRILAEGEDLEDPLYVYAERLFAEDGISY